MPVSYPLGKNSNDSGFQLSVQTQRSLRLLNGLRHEREGAWQGGGNGRRKRRARRRGRHPARRGNPARKAPGESQGLGFRVQSLRFRVSGSVGYRAKTMLHLWAFFL